MKKLLICLITLILLISALFTYKYFTKQNGNENKEVINKEEKEEEIKDTYIDNNPIILGLYKNYRNGKDRELIKEYQANWTYHQDISSFEVFYTNEDYISSKNQIKLIDEYKNKYANIDDYRIGYIISFNTNDNNINKTILSPKDTEEFYNYLEIYLYDDYHRDGSWYSHTTEEEFNNDTLLTSIKLTAGKDINAITSDIVLTVFTYDFDDFDDLGNYRGNSKYTITVKKNNI